VFTSDKEDKDRYGSELYLDGNRISGKKTFSGRTNYFGFKLGAGKYKEFVFSSPKQINDEENHKSG
jgi:hypothetical protein